MPYLDSVEFRPIGDGPTMESALQARDVDMVMTRSAHSASRLKDDYTQLLDYTSERTILTLNTASAEQNAGNPFTNVHARRALAHATDRGAIVSLIGENVQSTTQGYRPDTVWGVHEALTGYPEYDVAKAKLEIDKYKADTGQPSLSFTLMGLTNIDDAATMQALQAQWREVGIDAKIDSLDQVKFVTFMALGFFHAAFFRWTVFQIPILTSRTYSSETANPIGQLSINFTHYASETMDRNNTIQRESADFATRKEGERRDYQRDERAGAHHLALRHALRDHRAQECPGPEQPSHSPFRQLLLEALVGEFWIQR